MMWFLNYVTNNTPLNCLKITFKILRKTNIEYKNNSITLNDLYCFSMNSISHPTKMVKRTTIFIYFRVVSAGLIFEVQLIAILSNF